MILTRRQLLAGAAGLCASALDPLAAAPDRNAGWPRVITDALGRRVRIERMPRRIVPVFSSNTEIVAALGAADRIAAIDGLTHYPPEIIDRPRIGNRIGFSPERIARLNADLVILTPARHAAAQLMRPMRLAGIPLLVLEHPTLARILDNIALIGHAIGNASQAQSLIAKIETGLDTLAGRLSSQSPRRVYFETGAAGRSGFLSVRPDTYTDDILRHAGGVNVFAETDALSQVSGEAVYRANPDHILVAGSQADVAALRARPHWNAIPAVAAGRVDAIERAQVLIPGPRVVEGVGSVARALYPDLAKAADV